MSLTIDPGFDLGRLVDAILGRPPQEFRVSVRRPNDLLVFDFLVDNLKLKTSGEPRLEKQDPSASAHLIVELPPQSFAEEAFLAAPYAEKDIDKESCEYQRRNPPTPPEDVLALLPLPSSRVRMAGRSRLVFTMPTSETGLPFTLTAVLKAMRTWPQSLSVNASPDPVDLREVDWLGTLVASPAWRGTLASLMSAVKAAGAHEISDAIAASAQRVAEYAAGGLTGSTRSVLGKVMFETLHGEMEELVRRFPALREGLAHQAGLAALALASTEALAPAAARVGFDAELAGELPYFALLLGPHEPERNVTAVELPYRVILSPIAQARWLHSDAPIEHRGRTELWHTRLTMAQIENDFGADVPAKVRALWSPDYPPPALADPLPTFRASLDPRDRRMLVKLMSGYREKRPDKLTYIPRSAHANRLHLSALGGLLDVEGNWRQRPAEVDLEQWRHLATLGRDHYVRVVFAGYLCPLGHAASLVKVTERKFETLGPDPWRPNQRIAVLRQRFFLVCHERVKHYSGEDHEFGGLNFPIKEIEILTRVTPNLLEPGKGPSALKSASGGDVYPVPRMAFWPMVPASTSSGGEDFRFEIVVTDCCEHRHSFRMPLLFVGEIVNRTKSEPVRKAYNAAPPPRRSADLGGATVCYAPFDPAARADGDLQLPTSTMTFEAGKLRTLQSDGPNFYPEIQVASVRIPALQKMLGRNEAVEVEYPKAYKDGGFGGGNPGQVFLKLVRALRLEFGGAGQAKSDVLGALAAPEMSIVGLSRIMGPVSAKAPESPTDTVPETAMDNVVGDKFVPADFFRGARILGGVYLADILEPVSGLARPEVPKLLSRELPAEPSLGLPDRILASFEWETEVKRPDPLKLLIPWADSHKPATILKMKGCVTTPIGDPSAATYETHADLNNFKVNLFGFIIIWFEDLQFSSKKGQKPDVTVRLREGRDAVQFGGPLEFVNELRNWIPSNGFSDPPALAVTPSGIAARYSLNLPTVGVGIFSLSNVSLGAGFDLPFDARPASVRFNFAERQQPFSLAVAMLGGGGFFAIGVSARGVQEIEAALEFGAALAINLGVASGGVEIKAGVYFHWLERQDNNKCTVELVGYVRIHGELSVLGLISASLTFNLQLGYLKESGGSIVWGEASLIVEIEIMFFSIDVTVRVRREFAGGEADPKIIDLIPDAATWTEYCEAFATEAA
ncbi:MAG: hypothetical protein U0790_02210 [Isosphaeraceae bacterium]